jgi:cytochrome c-type biogenesis protein CcmI
VVIWVAAILLICAVALFIAAPLSDPFDGSNSVSGATPEQSRHDHALAVQALRELEFDHAMGKLDDGDYRVLRQRLEIRALAAMGGDEKQRDQLSTDQLVPVPASSTTSAAARAMAMSFCAQCGTRLDRAHNFCPNCGAARLLTAPL